MLLNKIWTQNTLFVNVKTWSYTFQVFRLFKCKFQSVCIRCLFLNSFKLNEIFEEELIQIFHFGRNCFSMRGREEVLKPYRFRSQSDIGSNAETFSCEFTQGYLVGYLTDIAYLSLLVSPPFFNKITTLASLCENCQNTYLTKEYII